jgi:hypothetical protein
VTDSRLISGGFLVFEAISGGREQLMGIPYEGDVITLRVEEAGGEPV